MADVGAPPNERMLAAARADNEEMLLEVFNNEEHDINHQDGMGNTALHYAASYGSTEVLEHILCHDDCDVDLVNNVGSQTPLHLALQVDDPEIRSYIVRSLLEAGADRTIRDKNGDTAEALGSSDPETAELFRGDAVRRYVDVDDIASENDDDEEFDEEE